MKAKKSKSTVSDRRKKYLQLTALEAALSRYIDRFSALYPLPEELIKVKQSFRRVTSRSIQARISSPFYRAAAMDGYAVRTPRIADANESQPVTLRKGDDAVPVDTGDPVPPGYDAVIMLEDIVESGENSIEITKSSAPGQHIRETGEDIVVSEMLYPSGHCIRPQDIACLLAAGLTEVPVRKRPTVAVIPTGSEIVDPEDIAPGGLKPGDIIDSSSSLLKAFLEDLGASVSILKIIPDKKELLRAAVIKELESADMVLIIAGSSAGREDYTSGVLEEIGDIHAHGLAIAPGKPTILASVGEKPCIGMPGYPVSTIIVADYIVKPMVYRMIGEPAPELKKCTAVLAAPLPSRLGVEEFVRVGLGRIGERIAAIPLSRSAGSLTSYVRADGIVRIPRLSEGIPEGSHVEVELIVPEERIDRTLVHQGSHDLCMNIILDMLWGQYGIWLSSFNVGSMGGLFAVKNGHAHFAGAHLFDPATGTYNTAAVKKYLSDTAIVSVHLAFREQGLIVSKGNPMKITEIHDLVDKKSRFVNRQKGSGTRILFDYLLKEKGIVPDQVAGYQREEYTHLAVASRVKEGTADAGLGLKASADALGLDFAPLCREEYDLIIPDQWFNDARVQALLSVVRSEEFRGRVRSLGGYDPSGSGKVYEPR